MAIQANPSYRNYMTDLEFQKRFPNLAKQQAQQGQLGQQGAFGAPLGSGTPYQNLNAPATSFGGAAPLDITAPLNLGMPGTTPSNLATSIYGNPAQANQPVFGNIAQPMGQTGQAAFGNITQPTTTNNLVKEVVGQDGQKPVDPNDSGMTDQMIEQLQVAEDARLKQVIREEEAKKLDAENKVREEEAKKREAEAKKLAEEAALTTEQRIERFTPVLQQQILGQQLTDKWSGQGHGSAEANAKDMSRILSSIGITDIRQFGKVPVYSEVQEIGKTYNGQQVITQSNEEGKIFNYISVPSGEVDFEGNPTSKYVEVPKDAKFESRYGISDGETTTAVDSAAITKDKNGKLVTKIGENFGNKVTGQQVPNTYSERQTGNAWGGTFAGKGNTGYRVQFADDGTPIFYTTYASSSDLGKLAPLLAIASFIPGLQPFAMAANALIAAKQGNILGALAGFTGLGGQLTGISGLTNASQALNFAGAAKNKNILGMLSSGANLAGTDMTGLANAAGLGDVASGLSGLNIGGLGISDALKAQNVVKAIQSGDPTSMIYALGGYAKDAANRDQNSSDPSSNELVKLIADKRRQSVPVEDREFARASVDDDFASSYGLGRLPDDLASLLPELPKFGGDVSSALPEMPSVDEDFPSSSARSPVLADAKSSRAKMNAGPAGARTINTGKGIDPSRLANYGGSKVDPNLMKAAAPYLGWDPSTYFPKTDIRMADPTSALGNVPETGYRSNEQTYVNMAPYLNKIEAKSPGTTADVLSHELAHVGQVLSSKPGDDISKQYLRMANEAGMSTSDRFNKPSDIKNFETTLNQSIKYINDKYGLSAGTYLGNPKAPLFEKLTDLAAIEMQTGKDLTQDPVLKETLFKDPKAVAMYNTMTIPRMSRLDPRDLPPGKVTSSDFPKGQVPFEFQLKNAIRRGKAEGGLTSLPRKRQLARA